MDYRIEKKEKFNIVGISMPLDRDMEKNFATVPQFWAKAAAESVIAKLCPYLDREPAGILGVSACGPNEDWKYYIAVASTQKPAAPFESYEVPAATWAVFPGRGNGLSVQEIEKRIITEWLPTSGYEYADAPDIEVYLDESSDNMRYEVWIPVIPAKK